MPSFGDITIADVLGDRLGIHTGSRRRAKPSSTPTSMTNSWTATPRAVRSRFVLRRGRTLDAFERARTWQPTARARWHREWAGADVSQKLSRFLFAPRTSSSSSVPAGRNVINTRRPGRGRRQLGPSVERRRARAARPTRVALGICRCRPASGPADDGAQLSSDSCDYAGRCSSAQAAHATVSLGSQVERQSSSGVVVSSGTGATPPLSVVRRWGRADLVLARLVRRGPPHTSISTQGILAESEELSLVVDPSPSLFGDGGMTASLTWGQSVQVLRAPRALLVDPGLSA